MNWWEASQEEVEVSPDLVMARHADYYAVFMADARGRAVLFDMMRWARMFDVEGIPRDDAINRDFTMMASFFAMVRRKCGLTDPLAELGALVDLATQFETGEPEQQEQANSLEP